MTECQAGSRAGRSVEAGAIAGFDALEYRQVGRYRHQSRAGHTPLGIGRLRLGRGEYAYNRAAVESIHPPPAAIDPTLVDGGYN